MNSSVKFQGNFWNKDCNYMNQQVNKTANDQMTGNYKDLAAIKIAQSGFNDVSKGWLC